MVRSRSTMVVALRAEPAPLPSVNSSVLPVSMPSSVNESVVTVLTRAARKLRRPQPL